MKLFKAKKYVKAAEEGHPKALAMMAENFLYGYCPNVTKAFEFATRAAEAGDAGGQLVLGKCYYRGWGTRIDWALALARFQLCEDDYAAESYKNRGTIYSQGGYAVEQDFTAAEDCFHKAAEAGSKESQFKLAGMFYNALGAQRSYAEARKWYNLAADQNYDPAQFMLGYMLYMGKGASEENAENAVQKLKGLALIESAAAQGNAGAKAFIASKAKRSTTK